MHFPCFSRLPPHVQLRSVHGRPNGNQRSTSKACQPNGQHTCLITGDGDQEKSYGNISTEMQIKSQGQHFHCHTKLSLQHFRGQVRSMIYFDSNGHYTDVMVNLLFMLHLWKYATPNVKPNQEINVFIRPTDHKLFDTYYITFFLAIFRSCFHITYHYYPIYNKHTSNVTDRWFTAEGQDFTMYTIFFPSNIKGIQSVTRNSTTLLNLLHLLKRSPHRYGSPIKDPG